MANNESEIARRLRNLSGRIVKDPISPGTSSGVRPDGTVNVNIPGRGPVRARAGNSCDAGECTLFEPENGEPIALGRSNSRVERENVARNVAGRNQENKKEPPATAICGLVYYVKYFDGFNQYAVEEIEESSTCALDSPLDRLWSDGCCYLGLPGSCTSVCGVYSGSVGNCATHFNSLGIHYVQVWLSEGASMPDIPPYQSQVSIETGRSGSVNISTSNGNSFLSIGHPEMPPSNASMADTHLFLGRHGERIPIPFIWDVLFPSEREMVNEHHGVESWQQYNPETNQNEPIEPPFEAISAYGRISPILDIDVSANESSLDVSFEHVLELVDPEGEDPDKYEDKLQLQKATNVSIFIRNETVSSNWYEHRIPVRLNGRRLRNGDFRPFRRNENPLIQEETIANIFDGQNIGNSLPTKAQRTPNVNLQSRIVSLGDEDGLLVIGEYEIAIAYFYETVTSQTLTISEATYDIYIHTNIGSTKVTTIELPESLLVEVDDSDSSGTLLKSTDYNDKIDIDYQILKLDEGEGPIALVAIKHHYRDKDDPELRGFEDIDIYEVSYTESSGLNSRKIETVGSRFYSQWFLIKDMQGVDDEDLEAFELSASKCLIDFSTDEGDGFPRRYFQYNFVNQGFTLNKVVENLDNEAELESLLYAPVDTEKEVSFLEIKVENEEEYTLCELSEERYYFSVFLPGIELDYRQINSNVNLEAKVIGCGGVRLS